MFLAVSSERPLSPVKRTLGIVALICAVLAAQSPASGSAPTFQASQDLRLELPANGNLRVENLRGGVIAELWDQNFVSVSAITDSGEHSRSPAMIQRSDTLLSVRVGRGPIGAQKINLELRIPARAHAAIVADSRTGNISSSFSSVAVNRTSRPQLQGRLGRGGNTVHLYSQAGNITL